MFHLCHIFSNYVKSLIVALNPDRPTEILYFYIVGLMRTITMIKWPEASIQSQWLIMHIPSPNNSYFRSIYVSYFIYVFWFPNFDHNPFKHHALHVLDPPVNDYVIILCSHKMSLSSR